MTGEGLFKIIILTGSLQGFVLTVLLWQMRKNKLSSRLLSVLIFLVALAGFNLCASSENWFGSPILQLLSQLLPMIIVMPVGPLLYFYLKACTDPAFRIERKHKWHFAPVIIDLLPSLFAIIYVSCVLLGLIKNEPGPAGNLIDTYNVYADIPRWLSLSIYLWFSYKELRSAKSGTSGFMQVIMAFMAFQLIWLAYLIPYVIPKYTDWVLDTFWWYPIYVPMAVLVYYLGLRGYLTAQKEPEEEKKETGIYTALSAAEIADIRQILEDIMENKQAYLDPMLNLNNLARQAALNPKLISAVLNSAMQTGFNEFVNKYRVAAFKKMVCTPESDKLTITGIAFNCGFNSQATFQRTFKSLTGMSPSAYKKLHSKTDLSS